VGFIGLTGALLMVTPVATAGDGMDGTADTVDGHVRAVECRVLSEAGFPEDDCAFEPSRSFSCVISGHTDSARATGDGLRYSLSGDIQCREGGRTTRTLRGTFATGQGLVTRTCTNVWCDKRGGIYDVYAATSYRPRCVYNFTGPDGQGRASQTLRVELPTSAGMFDVEDFEIANGDGVGSRYRAGRPTANFWVFDDGDSANGYSEGAAEVSVTMDNGGLDSASGLAAPNCLPTDQISGFAVQGTLAFEINEESIFRGPSN